MGGSDFTSSTFWYILSSMVSSEASEIIFLWIIGTMLYMITTFILRGFECYVVKKIFGGKYWWVKLTLYFLPIVGHIIYFKDHLLESKFILFITDQATKKIDSLFPFRQNWVTFVQVHFEETFIPDLCRIGRYMVTLFMWGLLFQIVLLPFEIVQRILSILALEKTKTKVRVSRFKLIF